MKKIYISLVVLLVILLSGYFIYQNNNQNKSKIKITSEYYENLKNKCEKSKFKNCCLDSIKTMEVIGAYKFGDFMIDGCANDYEIMKLRCPGAYTLCQPENKFKNKNFKPVPVNSQRVETKKTTIKNEILKDRQKILTKKIKDNFDNLFPGLDNEGKVCNSCAKNYLQKIHFVNKNKAIVFYEGHYNCEIGELDISSYKFKVIKTIINDNCDLNINK